MGRSPCCDESGLKKGPWTPEEDQLLIKYIQKHGHGSWRALPKLAGLNRCGKSCRLRWTNYLRPDIKRGKFSQDEEQTILHLHSILGNKWSAIASHLPGRTDNEIKNFWNTHLKKKLIHMGFDPMTHRPRTDVFSSLPHLVALANLKELIDHHQLDEHAMTRLQADAVQMAKLQYLQFLLQPQPPIGNSATITDMDTYNLLNSLSYNIKACPIPSNSSPQLDLTTISSLPQELNDISNSVPFSHLPDLQVSGSYETPILDKRMALSDQFNSSNCSWQLPTSSSTPFLPSIAVAPATQTNSSINNMGDASSTSSHVGEAPTSWPAELLLEDPLFHVIA